MRGNAYATEVENLGKDGVRYLYHGEGFTFRLHLKVSGIYNAYNSMAAIALCTDMGIKPTNAKSALMTLDVIPGRYEIIKDDITVIIDYAHILKEI